MDKYEIQIKEIVFIIKKFFVGLLFQLVENRLIFSLGLRWYF